MKIEDQFRVTVPIEEAWKVLLDVERIAPCMPGAQLEEIEGDEYRGSVKVKVGPITAQYKGAANIVEANEGTRTVVLKASGRDTRGQGNASATVTATLTADGDATIVAIDTDLNVTGKVAQFGRGVMADVSSKLLGQFVQNLERDVLGGAAPTAPPGPGPAPTAVASVPAAPDAGTGSDAPAPAPAEGGGVATSTQVRKVESPEAEPVDLFDAAGGAVAKRMLPLVGGALVLFVLWRLLRSKKD